MRTRGHTLLEVFMAMILVTLVIFAIVSLYPGTMAALTRSHDVSVGANLSQQVLENTRMQAFNDVTSSGPHTTQIDQTSFATNVTVNASATSVTTVNGVPHPGDPPIGDGTNLQHVQVVTSWNGTSQSTLDYVQFNFTNPP